MFVAGPRCYVHFANQPPPHSREADDPTPSTSLLSRSILFRILFGSFLGVPAMILVIEMTKPGVYDLRNEDSTSTWFGLYCCPPRSGLRRLSYVTCAKSELFLVLDFFLYYCCMWEYSNLVETLCFEEAKDSCRVTNVFDDGVQSFDPIDPSGNSDGSITNSIANNVALNDFNGVGPPYGWFLTPLPWFLIVVNNNAGFLCWPLALGPPLAVGGKNGTLD